MNKQYKKPLRAEQLADLPDSEINYDDIPELDQAFWAKAKVSPSKSKPNVSLRLPEEVVAHFKKESPRGYTSRMAAVLSAYVRAHKAGQDS